MAKVQKNFDIDADLLRRFESFYPMHGAFSKIVRKLIKQHLDQMEKRVERMLDES